MNGFEITLRGQNVDHTTQLLVNEKGDTFTYNPLTHYELSSFIGEGDKVTKSELLKQNKMLRAAQSLEDDDMYNSFILGENVDYKNQRDEYKELILKAAPYIGGLANLSGDIVELKKAINKVKEDTNEA